MAANPTLDFRLCTTAKPNLRDDRCHMHFPKSLIAHLCNGVPGFADEILQDQMSLARMLWMSTQTRRQHSEWNEMVSISKQDNRVIWGSDQRMREIVRHRYFSVLMGSNLGNGHTNAFKPNPKMKKALQRCLADLLNDEWIDNKGNVMRTFPGAIASMANKKKTKWKGVSPTNCIRIDVESMEALCLGFDREASRLRGVIAAKIGGNEEAIKELQRVTIRQLSVNALIKLSRNTICPGALPIRYQEQSTGRLFAEGLSLQSAPREIRNAALSGCWDYDISNCHWSLINELAAKHGHTCHAIRHYLENKAAVREEIAAGADITVAQAKECLLMIMYGAPASTWKDSSIPELIGIQAAKMLYELSTFKQLKVDVMKARSIIIKNLPVGKGGWVLNALGLQIQRTSKPKVLLAHILQGLEAKALMAVVRQHGDNIQLCVHDGWVSRVRLALDDLTKLISLEIGFNVEVEEAFLTPITSPELLGSEANGDVVNEFLETQNGQECDEEFVTACAPNSPVFEGLPPGAVQSKPNPASLVVSLSPEWIRRRDKAGREFKQEDLEQAPIVW